MLEPMQMLVVVVVSVLTTIVSLIGIQIYYILKEIRESVRKMNKMLDDGTIVSSSVAQTVGQVSGLLSGFKSVIKVLSMFKKDKE